jgi:hypothetical protein
MAENEKAGEWQDTSVGLIRQNQDGLESATADYLNALEAERRELQAEVGRLKLQDDHHNQLAAQYFDNWQEALAKSEADRKELRRLHQELLPLLPSLGELDRKLDGIVANVKADRALLRQMAEAARKLLFSHQLSFAELRAAFAAYDAAYPAEVSSP